MNEILVSSNIINGDHDEDAQADTEIWHYAFGFVKMAVVKCALELGISEAIENHGGPVSLSELATSLNCDPSALHRTMRFLIHHRFFKETVNGYVHTPLSRRLLRGAPNSMADLILLESTHVMLAPFHQLSSYLLDNKKPPFERAHGVDVWKFCALNPSHSKLIDDGMACDARLAVKAVIEGCPEICKGIETMVDVGGGNGTALNMFVKAFPWIQGINFDLPHVVEVAPKLDGVNHVGGDMFQCVPKADAAYLMKVLHDWGDDESAQILRRCKEAVVESNGKVIIVESIMDKDKDSEGLEFVRLMLDMIMMAHTGKGKERTLKEWDYVLNQAGFSRYEIKAINTYHSVIIAFP